ncbi:MAG: apolipoprotein N-acyltransferase [Paracoccaceae bacterium]|nr:MAG: apolipoprotein N-acyltransferase [Paracoccaceae bacterium]
MRALPLASLPLSGWPLRGAAFGLGAVAATGQAPLSFWWLALPALSVLTLAVARAATPRQAAALALWAGAGHFGLGLSWIVEPFLVDAPRHGWMAPLAVVLMAFGLALFWAVAGWMSARLQGVAARAMGFALALTAVEAARGVVLTGFPWALPGHVWIGTPVMQAAAHVGANGLTLIAAVAAALPVAFRWRGGGAAAAMVAGLWVWGSVRLADVPAPPPDAPVLRLVQPHAEQHLKWDADLARRHLDVALDLTRGNPGAPVPDLVIWPETALPYVLDSAPGALALIAEAGGGAPVAVGAQRSDGGWRAWNSLAVIGPDGGVGAVYDKHHLVPFGEYMPMGDLLFAWFGLRAFAAQEGHGYSAGPGPALLDLGPGLGRVLPLICYEAVFPAALRAPGGRADWILQITNDAWFGTLTGPYQHLAQARLRAVEQGLPLVRVANTGVSAVIDARGGVVATIPLGVRAARDLTLPVAAPPTIYARYGETPFWLLWAGCAAMAFAVSRRRRD